MRIAYISTGAAGMYCGTCIHDNTLASALIRQGHEVALIPTYTPTRTDEENVSQDQIFFGGVNIYLQHKSALFRHSPTFVRRLLDNRKLLGMVSRFQGSTRGEDLGGLTVDMLRGEEGHLGGELKRLTDWLRDDYRPDLVELNLAFFLGMARTLKRELGVPVLCAVQGEDIFIEQLQEPYKSQVLDELRKHARDVDAYIAPSKFYARSMSELLQVPEEMFHIVPLGIRLEGHGQGPSNPRPPDDPFTVGYLARICPEKGLHLLAEAFRLLAAKVGKSKVRLKVAGWLGQWDRPFFEEIEKQIQHWGLSDCWQHVGELDRLQKIDFLNSLDVLCVPTIYREPKGLFVLEALANSVPVVAPRHGSFPELIEATGGGILVEPESAPAVAQGLERLMRDEDLRSQLGHQGKIAVAEEFGDDGMARRTLVVYEGVFHAEAQRRRERAEEGEERDEGE